MLLLIKQERINKGWSQQYVADTIGISKQMVHDLEVGRRKPSYKVLIKLEKCFGMDHKELFSLCDKGDDNS